MYFILLMVQLNYSAMVDWYETLASQHPSTVTLVPSIGKTHYGRKIMALHFTDNSPHVVAGSVENRPVVYIQCLLHARKCAPYRDDGAANAPSVH